jgi:hypothetical protein
MSLTVTIGNKDTSIDLGDLANLQLQPSTFALAADVFTSAILDGPISGLSEDFLKASLTAGTKQQYKKTIDSATSITFGVTPNATCSVIVRKAGTVFPSSTDIKGDPTSTKTISVPAGQGYVSIVLSVSLDVKATGAFTSGSFGVSASIDSNDSFALANHFMFDQSKGVRDAIIDAFSRFVLPFGPDSSDLDRLKLGDMVESEFIGSLALSATLTEGFSGVLFGAFGQGGLSLSASSPLGSVLASAKPTFKLGLSFEVDYTHTDAFRMVILAQPDQIELRYFKRRTDDLVTKLDASATIDPGVKVDFTDKIPGLINSAAQKLVAGADAGVAQAFTQGVSQLVSTATQPLTDATNELNSVVPNLLKKLPALQVGATATFETVTENTVFGVFDFVRTDTTPVNSAAWKLAMSGDLQSAMHQPGVQLGIGSFVENSLTRSTTLSFAFFGLKAQTVDQYFKDATLTYAEKGQFQYRLKTGIGSTSNIFGHQKEADLYFLVGADLKTDGTIKGENVTLNFVRKDQNASDHSFSLGKTIALLLPSGGDSVASLLSDATRTNAKVPVTLTAQFKSSAFKNIKASPFDNGKPQPLDKQVEDQANFEAFTKAVNDVATNANVVFPAKLNDYKNVWAPVNENMGPKGGPPDRRQIGPLSNPKQAFADVTGFQNTDELVLRGFLALLVEAQLFMNLCDDLHQLSTMTGDTDSSDQFKRFVDEVNSIVKDDLTGFPQEFLNGILLALIRRMDTKPDTDGVTAPTSSDVKSFDVSITYS